MFDREREPEELDRRNFLARIIPVFACIAVAGSSSPLKLDEGSPTAIRRVVPDLKNRHKWNQSNGDTWDPSWADDDDLYAFNCDGRGFGTVARNLAFNRVTGTRPDLLVAR